MALNIAVGICNTILDVLNTGGTVTVTGPVKMRLMSANGNRTSAGTEVTAGGSYSAGGVVSGTAWAAAVAGAAETDTDITITNMPACSVVGIEFWDSTGTPKRLAWAALTESPQVVNAGGTFTLPAGAVTFTLG
jgi:hypothetical protein